MHVHDSQLTPRPQARGRIVLVCFLLIIGFLLAYEHRAHLFGYWPYALLLLCPLLHVFHHGGGHGSHSNHERPNRSSGPEGGGPS